MKKKIVQILTVVVLMYGMTVMSEASLVIRGTDTLGNKLIYDEDLDITWYDYSHPQDAWTSQLGWGLNLSVTYNSMIYDDWRLPTAGTTPVVGYNASGPDNEMEHLYYDEGSGGIPTEFSNIVSSSYWSGTEYAPDPYYEWRFNFTNGGQNPNYWDTDFYALAVRPGDVPGTSVPELPSGAIQLILMMGVLAVTFRKALNNECFNKKNSYFQQGLYCSYYSFFGRKKELRGESCFGVRC